MVLEIIKDHARGVSFALPDSIEVREGCSGSFLRMRLLKKDAATLLLNNVAQYICDRGFPGFPISRQNTEDRQALMR